MEAENAFDVMQIDTNHTAVSVETAPPPKRRMKKRAGKPDAVLYHCNYCRKDISDVIRIKCAQCADFDLCVECFSVGVELGAHKKDHDYHVMDILNFPLFEEDWGADEELLLLEGIEMYGLGNWGDVSDHVGTKLGHQCKEHYFGTYINVPTAPLPDLSHILTTAESLQAQRNAAKADNQMETDAEEEETKKQELLDKKAKEEAKAERAENAMKPNAAFVNHDVAGYMYLRGDFETEWDNEAEMNLCELSFPDDDTPAERDMKLKILESYNQKLDDRIRRKEFIKVRGLFEYKKMEKKLGKDKDLLDKLRPFARILSKDEHEEWLQGLVAERILRRRIEELKKYRKMGFQFLQDVQDVESGKRRRDGSEVTTRRGAREPIPMIPSERSTRQQNKQFAAKDKEEQLWQRVVKPRKPGAPLDITGAPGYDLLTDKERELCSQLRLFPQQYAVIKDTLLRESLRVGYLRKGSARQLVKIGTC
eukprot:TRINITY_DN3305_c1_g1_i2.p1 TRINITY_DN3305_c1_g1~~TRINITY_DN3305_c1_g1_i2.p1  ORF type:complete len:479 (-),score=126.33 TRINITY_DN3305_c1_g1_i2:96-1532(-)